MCEQAWERWWAEAPAGGTESALLLVEGAAGMGKTRLVRRLMGSVAARTAARLAVSFPASGGLVVDGVTDPAPTESADAARALDASLASVRPVLLVVEDVHHAGDRCLRRLRALLSEAPKPFAAVLTYRPEQLPEPGLPLGRAVDYPPHLRVARVRLKPLDEAQVRAAADELLGAERCTHAFVTRLHRRSGGVPQVVTDLLRTVRETGGHRKHFTAEDVDEAGIPVRLAESVLGRTAELSARDRLVVRAAAVLGEAAGARELAAVAGLGDDDGHAALLVALKAAVLQETDEGRYGFAVPLAAAAVRRELPGPVRERLHDGAAAMLAGRKPVPWPRLARHLRGGGRTEDWLRIAERVADSAGTAGEGEAVGLLEQALGVGGLSPEKRGRMALALARGAALGLPADGTIQVLRRIVADPALPDTVRGEIRLDLGLLLHNQGRRFDEGRAEVRRAVGELAARPALATLAMKALANPYFPGLTLEENLSWLRRAEQTAAASGDSTARTAVAACRATVSMSAGDPDAWRQVEQLPLDSPECADRRQAAIGLCNSANAAVYLGHYRGAGELLAKGLDLASRSEAPFLEHVGRGTVLFRDWLTGRWTGLAQRCTGLVAENGVASDARVVLALLSLAKGDWVVARDWLPPGDPSTYEGCETPVAATAAGTHVRLLLARQSIEAADTAAASAWAWLAEKGVWVWGAELAPWVVEAHVRAGNRQSADEVTVGFAAGLDGRDAPAARAALLWCRARLAEADCEFEAAAAGFRQASAAYAGLPQPYARALTAEGAARCAFASGTETDAAVEELTGCVAQLTELGAVWDAARVRADLRVRRPSEQRRPQGRPAWGERMSPREEEVAELAAGGLTNRQIAATLHLSPRTVEQHVARAMRKLGVRSRRELAAPDGG